MQNEIQNVKMSVMPSDLVCEMLAAFVKITGNLRIIAICLVIAVAFNLANAILLLWR